MGEALLSPEISADADAYDKRWPIGTKEGAVVSSDLYDYGYGSVRDYVRQVTRIICCDWMITNPRSECPHSFGMDGHANWLGRRSNVVTNDFVDRLAGRAGIEEVRHCGSNGTPLG